MMERQCDRVILPPLLWPSVTHLRLAVSDLGGSTVHSMQQNQIAGIILAAGAAARMGQPKQLLDWCGQPLVRAVAAEALAAQLAHVLVVLGSAAGAVVQALAGLPLTLVCNPDYAQGQSTSLRAGMAALPEGVDAAVMLLVDQPFVSAAIIDRLIEEWHRSRAPIVQPVYRGQPGNPVLFARALFSELLTVRGDRGARELIRANPARVLHVAFDDDRPLFDIDTPEAYAAARARHTGDGDHSAIPDHQDLRDHHAPGA